MSTANPKDARGLRMNITLTNPDGHPRQHFAFWLNGVQAAVETVMDLQILEAFDQPTAQSTQATTDVEVQSLFGSSTSASAQTDQREFSDSSSFGFGNQNFPPPDPLASLLLESTPRTHADPLESLFLLDAPQRPGTAQKFLIDTHANRLTLYPAAAYPTGSTYLEFDRFVRYTSDGTNWVEPIGMMIGATAALPSDLGANDAGFMFLDTTLNLFEHWTGAAWVQVVTSGFTGSATLAKLTVGGSTGSITFVNGLATAYSAPS